MKQTTGHTFAAPPLESANFYLHTPQGAVYGDFIDSGLRRLVLWDSADARTPPARVEPATESRMARALRIALGRYFGGQPEDFSAIPLDVEGGTDFQRAVWNAARSCPWGTTQSYGALAEALGHGGGHARAVGAALGANPVHILIPCHRFVASTGGLTGFAGGLAWKETLLQCEGALLL